MNFGPVFGVPMDPDEVRKHQEQAREYHDKQLMKLQDEVNRIHEFIGKLSVDDLGTLQKIVQRCGNGQDGDEGRVYYEGYIAGLLVHQHGRCACGEDHLNSEHVLIHTTQGPGGSPQSEG